MSWSTAVASALRWIFCDHLLLIVNNLYTTMTLHIHPQWQYFVNCRVGRLSLWCPVEFCCAFVHVLSISVCLQLKACDIRNLDVGIIGISFQIN